MKKFAMVLSVAVLAMAGTAHAQAAGKRDGVTTRAEAQARAEQRFARMDANKDGKLDAADREARRAAHFSAMDTNKDGQISRAEFDAMGQMRPGMPGGMGGPDSHGRGGHRMGKRGRDGMAGGMGAGMMRRADANGDRAITPDEFKAAALARFDRVDTNRDGTLTAEERQAARAAMRDRMRSRTAPAG
jgi:hypothetical protein